MKLISLISKLFKNSIIAGLIYIIVFLMITGIVVVLVMGVDYIRTLDILVTYKRILEIGYVFGVIVLAGTALLTLMNHTDEVETGNTTE